MLALLTALALTASTGGLGTLDAVADGRVADAVGDSSLTVSTVESGLVDPADPLPEDPPPEDPPLEDPPLEDPPPEDPPPEEMPNDPPEITGFSATITAGNSLVVVGVVVDEDPPTCLVEIDWLGVGYTATPNGDGSFTWEVGLEEGDTGWVTAVAVDSGGLESPPVEDLISP